MYGIRLAALAAACALAACTASDGISRPEESGPGTAAASSATTTATTAAVPAPTTSTTATATTTASTTTTTVADWRRFPASPVDPRPGTPVLTRINTTDPVVFLTIDDGYTRDPRIPDLLAEHGATATLFVVSGVAHQDPDYFRRFIDLGGSVNTHTIHHDHLPALDAATQRHEVCDAATSIERNVGAVGPYLRPPYGEWNSDTVAAARSCRLRAVVLWSVSVGHGAIAAPAGSIRAGDIILLHFRDDLYTDLVTVFAQLDQLGLSVARLEDYLPPH